MATAGPTLTGTGSNQAGIGTVAWVDPTNIQADDGTYSTAAITTGLASNYLRGVNFGFAIPAGATINGIEAITKWDQDITSGVGIITGGFQLIKTGTAQGDTKGNSDALPTTPREDTYGGVADLWGLALTAANVNGSDFGYQMYVGAGGTTVASGKVDCYKITVTYTPAPSGLGSFMMMGLGMLALLISPAFGAKFMQKHVQKSQTSVAGTFN